jgi:hypothetical protein
METSNDKVIVQRGFNAHLLELFDDIISIYPDNVNLITAKNGLENIKRLNPSIAIKAWYTRIYLPYNEVMDQGNLDFFFNKDYKSDVSHLSNVDNILRIIENLRGPLQNMSDINKEHTSKYLKNLCKLSKIYHDMSP